MGGFEGTSIALAVEHAEPPRPLTFAFMADVVAATGGRLRDVAITRLEKNTFYAVANIEDGEHRILSVDARPSDAIALATHMGTSIRAAPEVFDVQAAHNATHPDEAFTKERIGEARSGAAEIVAAVKGMWLVDDRPAVVTARRSSRDSMRTSWPATGPSGTLQTALEVADTR